MFKSRSLSGRFKCRNSNYFNKFPFAFSNMEKNMKMFPYISSLIRENNIQYLEIYDISCITEIKELHFTTLKVLQSTTFPSPCT